MRAIDRRDVCNYQPFKSITEEQKNTLSQNNSGVISRNNKMYVHSP